MNDNEKMFQYIGNMLYGTEKKPQLNMEELAPENRKLAEGIVFAMEKTREMVKLSTSIANGNLESETSRDNPLTGPLKDLQANLRHLTWQAEEISHGDYNQTVDFLGDFSKSFNQMISQLKLREKLMKENALMEREIFESKVRLEQEAERSNALQTELTQQLSYYERITEANNEMRDFRHDMKNHFLCIDSLLADQKPQEAREYIASVSDYLSRTKKILSSGNPVFDALLAEKADVCIKKNITLHTDIHIGAELSIDNMDWCILFANSLDNAIEAVQVIDDPEKRSIDLKIMTRGNVLNTVISNPTINKPQKKTDGAFYETTKKDSFNHGRGLSNISKVVEKYAGVMDTDITDGIFTLSFMLCGIQ